MGMFDNIKYKANCENCGTELFDFQSKDGECILDMLEPKDVDNFYAYCDECKTMNDFYVERVCIVKEIRR